MSTEFASVAPVAASERISSVDTVRGVALLGILLMNIASFGLPGAAYGDPTIAGGATGANLAFWMVNQILFEGKMRALFSMLFGAGVILVTARAEERGGEARIADIYYRRTLWLIAFGLVHAYFVWVGDILFFYGVTGLMLYPLRKLSPKALILAGVVTLALIAPRAILEDREVRKMRDEAAAADAAAAAGKKLTDEQAAAQKAWTEKLKELKPGATEISKEIADYRAGYWTVFKRRAKDVAAVESIIYYRYGFLDVAGMMLLGMGLLKAGVLSAARSYHFYALLTLLGYGIGAPLNAYIGRRIISTNFDPIQRILTGGTTYDLGRLSVALGHIGLVMLLCKAGLFRFLTRRLAAVGQMALTNYLLDSVACTLLFNGYGLGLFAKLERYQLLYVVFGMWTISLTVSPIWLRHFRFGPMEWVWRSLTHWRRQPMRLEAPAPVAEIALGSA